MIFIKSFFKSEKQIMFFIIIQMNLLHRGLNAYLYLHTISRNLEYYIDEMQLLN